MTSISFFGSSLVSAYWNGAVTYYRGILRNLNELGYKTTFYEPDAYERQQHRDIEDPDYAKVVVYQPNLDDLYHALNSAKQSDILIKASGVGIFDAELERLILEFKKPEARTIFWDVDAPATLERVQSNPEDPFRSLIPEYDFILTYGGGDPVIRAYRELGAKNCIPIYNALDPVTHHSDQPDARFNGALGFLANRMPDREQRMEEFFLRAAALTPDRTFILGGSGWETKQLPQNVRYIGHVYTKDHNAFNCTPLAVLNVNRASMARFGFSPPTRIFEAAGAGAAIITDAWEGIETFLEPGEEILVADNAEDVATQIQEMTPAESESVGRAAQAKVLARHTYRHRALQFQQEIGR